MGGWWTIIAYGSLSGFVAAAVGSVLWNGYKLWKAKENE